MPIDEGDPPKRKVESNTDRILKPKLEKSKPEPLPRGVVRAQTLTPGGGAFHSRRSTSTPSPQGADPSPAPKKDIKPPKDFNAIAANRPKDEFNAKAKDRSQGNDITQRPKPTRPR